MAYVIILVAAFLALQVAMNGKLMLTEKEFPINYAYGYTDLKRRVRWLSLPRFLLGSV
jgi:hypothetical protein